MEITVWEFVQLCCDPSMLKVCIFDLHSGMDVYKGYADEIPAKYEDMKVWSFDAPFCGTDTLEINIDMSEEV